MTGRTRRTILLGMLVFAAMNTQAFASPKADLWPKWEVHDEQSTVEIDHEVLDRFLQTYVVTGDPSGINLIRYAAVGPEDKRALAKYVEELQTVAVSELNRAEQKAYWINLYNALTVRLILDRYPVESIREIKINAGLFGGGPWKGKLLKIEGEEVRLDDIEHRILRPVWRDPRVHYAVNCASMGCPNLQPEAFTAANTDRLLEQGAREYINHPRGVRIEGNRLTASSIFKWFRDDFGDSREALVRHWLQYADEPLAGALHGFDGKYKYTYDWSLNEPE